MNEDDMIGIPDADEGAVTPPAPGTPAGTTPPTPSNGEVDGVLLDNDEQPATDQGSGDKDGETGSTTTGTSSAEGATSPDASTEVREESTQLGVNRQAQQTQSAPQLTDPGEFQPKDYSFDVALADGTTVRIAKPEDLDNLPENADFGTPKNLLDVQAKYSRMLNGIEADKREYEAKKEDFDKQQVSAADTEQRITTMVNEMNYLETKGKLPKIDPKYDNANWADPEVAKQPGIAERLALLEYRAKENAERTKLNLSPMSVLEAHMQMQNDAAEAKAADVKQKQGEQRKAKGSMVTGSSVLPTNDLPDDMIIGEGGSIRDISY